MFQKIIDWFKSLFKANEAQTPKPPTPPPAKPSPPPAQAPAADQAEENFQKAFAYTVGNEGGYTNDAADAGGPTNWGITQGDYSAYLGRHASAADVKAMPKSVAEDIYRAKYWKALSCDKMSQLPIAECMFDIGVVRGIGVPPKYAQAVCNANGFSLVQDGHIGPLTLQALNTIDPHVFVKGFEAKVEDGFRAIVASKPSQSVFLKGWLNRAKRLLGLA